MPSTPNRLQPDSSLADNFALANDNFDKAVQDISDLGARFSSVASSSSTLASGTSLQAAVSVSDTANSSQFTAGSLQIVPRIKVYVDTDADSNYLLGFSGGSLTTEQKNCMVSIWPNRTYPNGTLAAFIIMFHNYGASSHTYYWTVDVSYVQSPRTGYFR